jgi:hypothetical protein
MDLWDTHLLGEVEIMEQSSTLRNFSRFEEWNCGEYSETFTKDGIDNRQFIDVRNGG